MAAWTFGLLQIFCPGLTGGNHLGDRHQKADVSCVGIVCRLSGGIKVSLRFQTEEIEALYPRPAQVNVLGKTSD